MAALGTATDRSWPRWARYLGARPRGRRGEPYPWLKLGIFLGGLVPLASLAVRALMDTLGANPVAALENELGLTALLFLLLTIACSPARRLFGWTWPMRVRREVGLFTFGYASLHFLAYLVLDQFLDWRMIVEDIVERPFITVGVAAWLLMVPLAITSTNGWVRRLGYGRWVRVHQLVYLTVILAAIHFIWRVKIDVSQPLSYAAIFGVLLTIRVGLWIQRRRSGGTRSERSRLDNERP